jgi:hypothetical protein
MDDDTDDDTMGDRSVNDTQSCIENLGPIGAVAIAHGSPKNRASNLSPSRHNLFEQAQSPVVHLQKDFDEVNGYDSDDGPCFKAVQEEGPLIVDETELPDNIICEELVVPVEVIAEVVNELVDNNVVVIIPDKDIDKLSVAQLREDLSKRDLWKEGKKNELRLRLKDAMEIRVLYRDPKVSAKDAQQEVVAGFSQHAKWCLLNPIEDVVKEPENAFTGAHAPTIPSQDAAHVPQKTKFRRTLQQRRILRNMSSSKKI